MLTERRSGYVIIFLGSLLSLAVPVLHMMGKGVGVGSSIAKSSGGFFFIWTLFALGVTALFSVILSMRGLWSLRQSQSGSPKATNMETHTASTLTNCEQTQREVG
jgi:hypothetical protein